MRFVLWEWRWRGEGHEAITDVLGSWVRKYGGVNQLILRIGMELKPILSAIVISHGNFDAGRASS